MLTIALDIDGVIADWVGHALASLKPYGCPTKPHEVTAYDIRACIPRHTHAVLDRLPYMPGFCRSILPFPGATSYLRELRTLGRVVALTTASPGPHWKAERHEWLTGYGFADSDICIVDSHEEKIDYAADVLIEDRAETLRHAKQRWKQLFLRPYNALEHVPGVMRASNYQHSLALLRAPLLC